jgi:hypothetical protein
MSLIAMLPASSNVVWITGRLRVWITGRLRVWITDHSCPAMSFDLTGGHSPRHQHTRPATSSTRFQALRTSGSSGKGPFTPGYITRHTRAGCSARGSPPASAAPLSAPSPGPPSAACGDPFAVPLVAAGSTTTCGSCMPPSDSPPAAPSCCDAGCGCCCSSAAAPSTPSPPAAAAADVLPAGSPAPCSASVSGPSPSLTMKVDRPLPGPCPSAPAAAAGSSMYAGGRPSRTMRSNQGGGCAALGMPAGRRQQQVTSPAAYHPVCEQQRDQPAPAATPLTGWCQVHYTNMHSGPWTMLYGKPSLQLTCSRHICCAVCL